MIDSFAGNLSITLYSRDQRGFLFFLTVDQGGHAVGDMVLKEVSDACVSTLRRIDSIGRLGGEEFAVIMPDTDLEGGRKTAERLREFIENLRILWEGNHIGVTVSIGVGVLSNPNGQIEDLLHWADKAMYTAKSEGRDRVAAALHDFSARLVSQPRGGFPVEKGHTRC